jgi:hypothetical protein
VKRVTERKSIISTQSFEAVTVLAYCGIILTHILGKYYVRGAALTADWLIANALDGIVRPSPSILEMIIGYGIFETQKPQNLNWEAVLAFYKKRAIEWWLPIFATIGIILLYWGSYDKKTSITFASIFLTFDGTLKTVAYPFWLGLVLIAADLFAPICWVLDKQTKRYGIHLMMLSWVVLILAPSFLGLVSGAIAGNLPGLFSEPITRHLFARDLGFLLFGGYYLVPTVRYLSTHAARLRRPLLIGLFVSFGITLCVPLYEHFSGIDPWYPHTLRNYSMPYVASYSFLIAISIFMFLEKHKDWSKNISRFLYLCFPSYLAHSWFIECGIYWRLSIPIFGLIVKVVLVASVILGWAWLCRYIQLDLRDSQITLGEES